MREQVNETQNTFTTSRRNFLKGAGAMALGMGMMPILSLFGVNAEEKEVEAVADAAVDAALKSQLDFNATSNEDLIKSDALMQQVLNESEVTSDLTLSDGTVIPAVYVRMRNRINRIGRGIGSIPNANSYELIMYLWSEEDAENYMKMPLHQVFTAANYMENTGFDEETATAILEDQANRCLIWRMRRAGLTFYSLMPYINGFWEFGELQRAYAGDVAAVAEFDSQGISGTDPNAGGGFDTTFPLFRSYPIGVEVVEGDKLEPWQDWRALIKRNNKITVSPCQCRTMWNALGVPYPEEHPLNTCLSLGEMAEYFIENGIGDEITQDEAIAIVEDIIDKGMVVESICAKNADIICCCHSKSCGNLMAYRGINGEAACAPYYSAYNLQYDADKCVKCGACVNICPMDSITMDGEGGICVMDNACVRCGQCVKACPVNARILTPVEGYPELPEDYLDCNKYFAKDRMRRGQLVDFTESTLEV